MKNACRIVSFLIVLGVAGAYAADTKPVRVSPETTLIVEPLAADGKGVDYLKAYERQTYPAGWDDDRNGYRLLVEKLGVSADSIFPDMMFQSPGEEQKLVYAEQTYRKLGLAGEPKLAEPFREIAEFLKAEAGGEAVDFMKFENTPWTLETNPELGPWLEEIAPTLAVVKEAFDRPVFCVPCVSAYENPTFSQCDIILNGNPFRSFARTLRIRAEYYVRTGDIDKAIDDIITIKKIGWHLSRQKIRVPVLIGIAISGIADGIGLNADLQKQADRRQLQRLAEAVRKWDVDVDLEAVSLFDRYYALDLLQRMAAEDDIRPIIDPLYFSFGFLFVQDEELRNEMRDMWYESFYRISKNIRDWNPVLEYVNACFAEGKEPEGLEAFRDPEKNRFDDTGMSDRERGELFGNLFLARICHIEDNRAIQTAIDRRHCSNNLRRVALALLTYHVDYDALPPAFTVDRNGKPLHSWRVLLLPYLGHDALYRQIRLNEPWDSDFNRQFHNTVIDVYRCPARQAGPGLSPGMTSYSVVVGESTPFHATGKGRKLSEFEAVADMILVLETMKPVCWMNPSADVTFEQIANIPPEEWRFINYEWVKENIFAAHSYGLNVATGDGKADFMSDTTNDKTFYNMLQGLKDEP